jgi:penicillin-binding protein 1C
VIAGRAQKTAGRKWKLYLFFLLSALSLLGFIALLVFLPLPERVTPKYSTAVYSHQGTLLHAYLTPEGVWRFPVDLNSLPPFVIPALLAREDQRFYQHFGVDPIAVARAAIQNIVAGHVVSGGSTITMQLARLIEPHPRTFTAKMIEAFRALQLEYHFSKSEILRLYLAYAPYGGNIEGINAAAYVYFRHAPADITIAETAILLLLPQAPSRWQHYHEQQWREARKQVLNQWLAQGLINDAQYQLADAEAVPNHRYHIPRRAAHYSHYLKRQSPQQQRIDSTIASDTQRMVRRVVQRIQPQYQTMGIDNIAVLVVENQSRAIRAAIGNFNPTAREKGQSFASFDVARSPGSTLKPFLYAIAIEQGELLPQTLLLDVPTHFNGYDPHNFSGSYSGLVTAEQALSQSLNIPFVRLLHRIGLAYFINTLEAGVDWHFDHSRDLGLSMVIGGVELTPLQLLSLYVNLAHGGTAAPLRYLRDTPKAPEQPWLDAGAVMLTEQALSKRDRPDFPQRQDISLENNHIRWKTGTSQGWRDAWSVGYDDHYTVLVWFGNLDQHSSPFLTGSVAAAPVMFELLESLHQRETTSKPVHKVMPKLEQIEVCAFSGDTPTVHCRHRRSVLGLKDHPLRGSCRFHRQVLLDDATGERVTRNCDQGRASHREQVIQLPPMVRRWYGEQQGTELMMPPFSPACRKHSTEYGTLHIRRPLNGSIYMLLPSLGRNDVIVPLDIESSSSLANASCFLNGKQLTQTTPWLLTLGAGHYTLFCSNEQNGSEEITFTVQAAKGASKQGLLR